MNCESIYCSNWGEKDDLLSIQAELSTDGYMKRFIYNYYHSLMIRSFFYSNIFNIWPKLTLSQAMLGNQTPPRYSSLIRLPARPMTNQFLLDSVRRKRSIRRYGDECNSLIWFDKPTIRDEFVWFGPVIRHCGVKNKGAWCSQWDIECRSHQLDPRLNTLDELRTLLRTNVWLFLIAAYRIR
jgi:hypothetical protein